MIYAPTLFFVMAVLASMLTLSITPAMADNSFELYLEYSYRPGGTAPPKPLSEDIVLNPGDSYRIQFKATKRCYVYIFRYTSHNHNLYPLFPSSMARETNVLYSVPSNNDYITIDDQPRDETLYIHASLLPVDSFEKYRRDMSVDGHTNNRNELRNAIITRIERSERGLPARYVPLPREKLSGDIKARILLCKDGSCIDKLTFKTQ